MQRTDSIFFISVKQICGRESPGGSLNSLSQTRVTRNEIGEIYIGLPVQDFKIISTHLLITETKQMQSSIKKSGWIIDHLKISWCALSLSSFTRFCLQDFYKSKS